VVRRIKIFGANFETKLQILLRGPELTASGLRIPNVHLHPNREFE
jgi:hypothetical protein